MPLDRFEQACVCQGDRGLVREGLHERDVGIAECSWLAPHEDDGPDQVLIDLDRHPEQGSVPVRAGIDVLGVVEDVRDVHRLSGDGRAAGSRRSVERMRMRPVVFSTRGLPVMCGDNQELLLQEIERPVIGVAESFAGFDDLVQHRLQPGRTGDSVEDATDRALLLTEIRKLARSVLVVADRAPHRDQPRTHDGTVIAINDRRAASGEPQSSAHRLLHELGDLLL